MTPPEPRGPLSALLLRTLSGVPGELTAQDRAGLEAAAEAACAAADPVADEDLQLSLWVLYELHYRGFATVDDRWEWHPGLLAVRQQLEQAFETFLRERTREQVARASEAARSDLPGALFALAESDDGPSVSGYARSRMTREQWDELLLLRAVSQLKEADPHSFAVPRLQRAAKVHLVEILYDEYGAGRPERQHAVLYADAMRASGLDPADGGYVDRAPAVVLAASNVVSTFALHRRLRAAAAGHFAMVETTSSLPSKGYVGAAQRLGLPEQAWAYFDEHVEADAVHEQVAIRDLCGALVAREPAELESVVFGMAAGLYLEGRVGSHLLERWHRGESALRGPVAAGLQEPA
ncbi:iron-containing redox enzyme family protein [Ornithinicoccus halotolerans]|uniref:iron-containing redox enzyme family protein n=1 Tax=Ornithinicoccus halotolerans TaxID=1748220 RepID=UPI0012951A9C|nr:iron-containing redox enzyme family protein [Ornithinicoccus halotolerans]